MKTLLTRATAVFAMSICALTVGCDAELNVGNVDGSIFDEDAGMDPDAGGDSGGTGGGGTGGSGGSGGTGGTGGSGGGTVDVSGVPQFLAEGLCSALEACEGVQLLTNTLDGQDCAEVTGNVFTARRGDALADSVADGRIVFDASRMAACLSAIESQGCEVQISRRPAACEEAIEGKVALGGDCVINEDCAGTTTYCAPQAQCPGQCQALLNSGMPCTNSDQCANGTACEFIDGVRQCTTQGTAGQECNIASRPTCRRGFTCTPNPGDNDTCKSNSIVYGLQAGQTCAPPGSMCEPGLACTLQPNNVTICAPIADSGGACFRAQPTHCPPDQFCNAATGMEGVCVDLPGDNEACRDRAPECGAGLTCVGATDQSTGFCRFVGENGDGCSEPSECYSGNCQDSLCQEPAALCTL